MTARSGLLGSKNSNNSIIIHQITVSPGGWLDDHRRYVLETVDPAGKSASGLVGGVYDGLVYLKDPPLPLANVRVVSMRMPQR